MKLEITLKSGATLTHEVEGWKIRTTGDKLTFFERVLKEESRRSLVFIDLEEVAAIVEVKK